MSWQRFLDFDSDDSETRELKRTREILMKKQRKEELRQEVTALKKRFGGPEKKKPLTDQVWSKHGITVTDARNRK